MPDKPVDEAGTRDNPTLQETKEHSADKIATPAGTCLAFDYGSKRIGTAVGEARLQRARPLAVVINTNGTPDWKTIDDMVEQWQPTDLVVGWPLTEAGEEQTITLHVGGFIKRLVKRYALPVHKADERFSSNAAQEVIREQRKSGQSKRKTRHGDVDKVAAALILEYWFSLRE